MTAKTKKCAQTSASYLEKLLEERDKLNAEIESIWEGALILNKVEDPIIDTYQIQVVKSGQKKLAAMFLGFNEQEVKAAYDAICGLRGTVKVPAQFMESLR